MRIRTRVGRAVGREGGNRVFTSSFSLRALVDGTSTVGLLPGAWAAHLTDLEPL